jgi:hypothetical protein
LSRESEDDVRVEFVFFDDSASGACEGTIELAAPKDYTEVRERLYDLLDAEYQQRNITEAVYRHIRGIHRGESPGRAPGRQGSSAGFQKLAKQKAARKTPHQAAKIAYHLSLPAEHRQRRPSPLPHHRFERRARHINQLAQGPIAEQTLRRVGHARGSAVESAR